MKLKLTLLAAIITIFSCQKQDVTLEPLLTQKTEREPDPQASKHSYTAEGLDEDATHLIDAFTQGTDWDLYRTSQYSQQPGLLYVDFYGDNSEDDPRLFSEGNVIRLNLYDKSHGDFVSVGQTITSTNSGEWIAIPGAEIFSELEVGDKVRIGNEQYTISLVEYFGGDYTSIKVEAGFIAYAEGVDISIQRDGWKRNMVRVFRKNKVISTYRVRAESNSLLAWRADMTQGLFWGLNDMRARPDNWNLRKFRSSGNDRHEDYDVGASIEVILDDFENTFKATIWVRQHTSNGALHITRVKSFNSDLPNGTGALALARDYIEQEGHDILLEHDDDLTLQDALDFADYVEINHTDLTSGTYAGWQRKSYANWDQYDLGYHLSVFTREGETSFSIAYKDFHPLGDPIYGDNIAQLFIDAYERILMDIEN